MLNNNLSIVQSYYTEMSQKNRAGLEKYLHSNVHFKGPLAEITGKAGVLEAIQKLMSHFNTLTIRKLFSKENQVMIVYDFDFPKPVGTCSTAALIDVDDGLIRKIELFFDARPFGAF